MSKPLVAISTDFLNAFAALPRHKQGKVTEFFNKFRNNPLSPSIHYEKIVDGIDENIRSVRIDDTYRGIVVKQEESGVYMLLWVDHHDEAYAWAKHKKCSINKVTGSVQVFDVEQVVKQEIVKKTHNLFDQVTDEQLSKIGIPEEQAVLVRSISSLEELYLRKKNIPEEAYEGLEWIGNGFDPNEVINTFYQDQRKDIIDECDYIKALASDGSKKSFVVLDGEDELKRIMSEPLEKWRIFLHPTQRKIVNKKYSGAARVLGGAGTGKTVVAMHRAKQLASNLENNEHILFTTYTKNLADDIKENLRKICSVNEMKKIDVINLDAWVVNFLREQGYEYQIVYDADTNQSWEDAIAYVGSELDFTIGFYKDEWSKIVQAQEVYNKEAYLKAPRIGRGIRLDRKKRMLVWKVFEEYQNIMNEKQQRDVETAMYECRKIIENKNIDSYYSSIIIDEGQDLSQSAYRLLRALAGEEHENDLFIVGDAHQRIYKNKAILSKCGINIRGRSHYLRINYRTTEEIRKYAFGLLKGIAFDDLDEEYDDGRVCQSLTHGEKPEVNDFDTLEQECQFIIHKIKALEEMGTELRNICIVARTHRLLENYSVALQNEGIRSFEIKANKVDDHSLPGVRIATMHRVKGLEFDYVFAAAINHRILPFSTLDYTEDNIAHEEYIVSEKCLLYVALTRARKSAFITGYGSMSELIV